MSDIGDQGRYGASWDSSNPGELYRILFEEAADGIFITDSQGQFIAVNPRGIELTGYFREELLGLNFSALFPPEDLACDPIRIDDLRQGKIVIKERQIRRKDGRLLPVEISARMLPAGNLLGIVRDIKERKRTEAISEQRARELTALEALGLAVSASLSLERTTAAALRGMLEAVEPDLAFLFLREGDRLILQGVLPPEAQQVLGAVPEHRVGECICGLAVREGRPIYSPKIQDDRRCTWEECKRVGIRSFAALPVRAGEEIIGVIGLASLTERDFEARADFLETLAHQVSMALANARLYEAARRELAERQQAEQTLRENEEKYRRLIETTGTGYVILDDQGRVIDANQKYAQLTGRQQLEEVIGHSVLEWTAPHDLERNEAEVRKCLDRGFVRHLEIDYVTPTGRFIPVEINATVFHLSGTLRILTLCRDITDRRRAEEALQAKTKDLDRFFTVALDLLCIADTDGYLRRLNPQWGAVLGYPLADLEGKRFLDLVHPEDLEATLAAVGRLANQETVLDFTNRYRCRDGSYRWIEWRSYPAGNLIYAAARDITERKLAEEAIRVNEERLRSVVDSAPFGAHLYELDEHDRLIFSGHNKSANRILGVDNAQFLGKTIEEAFPPLAETDIPARYKRVAATGEGFAIKQVDYDHGKIRGAFEVHAFQNAPRRMAAFFIDITDRKRAEEKLREIAARYRALFESNPHPMWVYDPKTLAFLAVNDAAVAHYGFTRDEFRLMTIADIRPPEDLPRLLEIVPQLGELRVDKTGTWSHRRKDGSIIDVEITSHALDYRGRRARLVLANDITERKRAEEEKDALQAQLLQAQKMESVGQLAGGVAHDFNNMLSAIIGHSELAMMQCTPADPIHSNLKAIQNAAQRSADLTRQLLAFARKQTVAPKVLDLNDTVAGMLKMLLRLIGEDIDLVWMPGAGLWPVKLDPSQIDQLLANLCVNARDAIAGVGKVTIETENIAFDKAYCAVHPGFVCGEYVLLAVSDDGCGMTKEVLEHLFEPFFTTKEVGKGTGLGLATVYGIVKQNEGFINVYSEPVRGSTFKIYLPRFAGEVLEPLAASTVEIPKGHGETVLLVEDEAAILDVGRTMLERLGYTVLTAGTPGEALRLAKAHAEIQLLITDVVMPEMNGRDLAISISAIKPGLKCLFISGYTANVIAHRGILDEGVHFLQKPFSLKDLAPKVRQALEKDCPF